MFHHSAGEIVDYYPGKPVKPPTFNIKNLWEIGKLDRGAQLGISQERVHVIIHKDLQITKVSTRWGPKLFVWTRNEPSAAYSGETVPFFREELLIIT